MTLFYTFFIIHVAFILVLMTWVSACITRGLNQRIKMLDIKEEPSPLIEHKLEKFNDVSQNKHLWYLITFRNPHKLYDPILLDDFKPYKNLKLIKENITVYGYYKYASRFIFHNNNGPAIDGNDEKIWYFHGKKHREVGPAAIYSDPSTSHWFYHGKSVTGKVKKWLTDRDISDYKDMSEEDKLALTFYMRSLV